MYVVLKAEKSESGLNCLLAFSTLAKAKDYVFDQRQFFPILALDMNGENLLAEKALDT